MATKRKADSKKDLENKIAQLEAKLSQLSEKVSKQTSPPPAPKPQAKPKPAPAKPKEAPKPAKAGSAPANMQQALEDAYQNAPQTDFHQYRAKVTGYSPAPNRYFVRRTAPVGKVPTSDWNKQKVTVTGYTQPSNQYFATRARLAYHPPEKTFASFGGVDMAIDGMTHAKPEVKLDAPKPPETKPEISQDKSKQEQLAEYEKDYLERIEQQKVEEKADKPADGAKKSSATHGTLPKGFEAKPKPKPEAKKPRGTLPKGF